MPSSPSNNILSLDSSQAQLQNAGGKGANLSRLVRAGFHVPPGFIITTRAYSEFVAAHSLSQPIEQLVEHINPQDARQLDQVSGQIRQLFAQQEIPPGIQEQILAEYQGFDHQPVAVRSSATAEDLPGFSFAGQQDTFLNIINSQQLLDAVRSCWSSLWTARAIGYRERNHISHAAVSQAVVVQVMIPSQASGVIFTANPLTGARFETVIDATLGVGEALVSGKVEPDHFVVDRRQGLVVERNIGAKSLIMEPDQGGGLRTKTTPPGQEQAISDQMILILSQLGEQVAEHFGFPQDIEWGIYQDQICLLQSRPITSLYPLPDNLPAEPLQALFSFGAVQGILDPMTPLGQDAIRLIFAGGASLFNLDLDYNSQPVIVSAGERLWANITPLIRNSLGARVVPRVFSAIDPSLQNILAKLISLPGLGVGRGRIRLSTLRRVAGFIFPFLRRTFHYLRKPNGMAERIQRESQAEIERLEQKYSLRSGQPHELSDLVVLFMEIYNAFPYVIPHIASGAAAGIIPFFLLNKLSQTLTGSNQTSLEITRGLEHNVTTQMDLQLWSLASQVRSDPAALDTFQSESTRQITRGYLEGRLPETAQVGIATFLEKYGMRGLGEIDIGRPRWREDSAYVIDVIRGYLQITDPELAPDALFEQGQHKAQQAIQDLQAAAEVTFAGGLKSRLIGRLALALRELAGLRESPKFHIIQLMGLIRRAFLARGEQLVAGGILEQSDDLFFLTLDQLQAFAAGERQDWRRVIQERRALYQRELKRSPIPRLFLSDGRAYYEGITHSDAGSGLLAGSPVSPGSIEGLVRVVLDPLNAELEPGEIMVCPGTDPAWTPLFMTAAGLIMEVGGMMTHGAIVAREYGIPAVVGLDQATTRLKTGQRIRLNGTTGEVQILSG